MIKINYQFIKINNSIFDYKQYIKEVEWLKWNVKQRLLDILDKDFVTVEEFEESYDKLNITFYNKRLDIRLEVECFKQSEETFV
ncbi:hypothetical protein GOV08_04930 [Candidatus Woesearchaeota archaeon]|nr:hypothetical protein [Candidatus Woesearchaeota archaeon]